MTHSNLTIYKMPTKQGDHILKGQVTVQQEGFVTHHQQKGGEEKAQGQTASTQRLY